jgi:type II secretory pathway predicted ATPase ExeA
MTPEQASGGPVPTAPPSGHRRSARPFVGRGREIEELRDALERAAAGYGGVVVVTGEAGIGKTRLLQEAADRAADEGWTVLAGRCWEEGGAPAYWPWIQVVRAAGADFAEVVAPSAHAGDQADPESVRFALFDAVTRFLLERAGETRHLVVLEDLHAADEPSLLLLRFLGESIANVPIAVLCSYREGEPRVRELASLFAGVARTGRRVALRGLTREDVEAYVEGVVGEAVAPALAARLHSVTGGNPFFLGELIRAVDAAELTGAARPTWRIPEEVRAVIRRRLDRLSPEASSLLQLAAVAGRELDLPVLERVSRLGRGRLVDALGEALEAGVLVEDIGDQRHAFAHDLVRETLYEDLSARRRLELHLRLGDVLEELARGDPDRRLSEIAHHLALAAPLGDLGKAADYVERAGDRAAALLAYEEAARHYTRGLQLLETDVEGADLRRCELLLRLADAQWRSGDVRTARATFEDATAVARRLGDGQLLARAALGYVTALGGFLFYARFEVGATGADLLSEALAALPDEDSRLRASLLARLAAELINEPVERRAKVSHEAVEVARRLGDPRALVTAFHARHWALTAPELVLERLAQTEEMLETAERIPDREMEFLAHNARFHCFLELGDGPALDREIEAMVAIAELIRQPAYLWHAHAVRVVRAILDGRYANAEELAASGLELGRLRLSAYPTYVFRYTQLFAIRWAQGRLDELWPSIRSHADLYPWVPRWRDALAAAELGDERAARAEVERFARDGFAGVLRDGLWLLHMSSLAEACVLIRDKDRGHVLYEVLDPHGDRNAVSYTQQPFGPVALRLGMLATMLGHWADAERQFVRARERCELVGAPAFLARVLAEHARMLLARGDGQSAAPLLAEAAALCEELGLPSLRRRIEGLLPEGSPPVSYVFRHEGEIWTISYGRDAFRLRDVKGLRYLAYLLASPGVEVHAVELAQAVEGVEPAQADGSPGPALDAQAKDAYRTRLQELGEELEEARGWADLERVARVEDEIDSLTGELSRALGLGGRDRAGASPAERARVSVTKAIRSAIRTVERHSPALAEHLATSVRTGQFCSYAPPGQAPPQWQL